MIWSFRRRRDRSDAKVLRDAHAPIAEQLPPVACFDCALVHHLPKRFAEAIASAHGFIERHAGHAVSFIDPARPVFGALGEWRGNADVKTALQALQSLTVTNLHNLASSPTAGWQSAEIDNTSNLFHDSLVQVVLDFANTAPANSRAAFIYAAGGLETGKLSNPFSGTEGTLTLVDVTANAQNAKCIGTVPYTTADEVAEGSPMSVAQGFGGNLTPFWAVGIINHSGAALAAAGNTVKYRGVYATVI